MAPICDAPRDRGISSQTEWRGISCCCGGAVHVPPVERSAEVDALWDDDDSTKLLRKHAWPLNNSLALASSSMNQPSNLPGGSSWSPTVSVQGKMYHNIGALNPAPGVEKRWAQLYVYDPAVDETTRRGASLRLGSHVSQRERANTEALLTALQHALHNDNSYVHDFVSAGELFDEEPATEVELVLSRDARPAGTHARQYDPGTTGGRSRPRTFAETTVLMIEGELEKGCVQLRRRDAPLHRINFNHRSFGPLHFVLLFPCGDDGWRRYTCLARLLEARAALAVRRMRGLLSAQAVAAPTKTMTTATTATTRASPAAAAATRRRRRRRRRAPRRVLARRRGASESRSPAASTTRTGCRSASCPMGAGATTRSTGGAACSRSTAVSRSPRRRRSGCAGTRRARAVPAAHARRWQLFRLGGPEQRAAVRADAVAERAEVLRHGGGEGGRVVREQVLPLRALLSPGGRRRRASRRRASLERFDARRSSGIWRTRGPSGRSSPRHCHSSAECEPVNGALAKRCCSTHARISSFLSSALIHDCSLLGSCRCWGGRRRRRSRRRGRARRRCPTTARRSACAARPTALSRRLVSASIQLSNIGRPSSVKRG